MQQLSLACQYGPHYPKVVCLTHDARLVVAVWPSIGYHTIMFLEWRTASCQVGYGSKHYSAIFVAIYETKMISNNDILRRIRFIFDFGDAKMMKIFSLATMEVTRAQVSCWLKKDEDPEFVEITDSQLAHFLNGFISEMRGQKEGPQPIVESRLNNNIVFRKLKIALNLKDEDILEILKEVDFKLGKHELSAFFRNPNQQQYRPCGDQILRNFLNGLQKRYSEE